jgi:hypothetical protein
VLELARALRDAAQGASTQVVRRRKLEARARGRGKQSGDAQVSPFFNPIQSPPSEGIRVSAPLGRLWALRRLIPPLPVSVWARIGLALGILLVAFGAVAVLMRHPPKAAVTAAAAPRIEAAPRTQATTPADTPPHAAPAPAAEAPPPPSRIAVEVEPIAKPAVVDVLPATASPAPTAVKRARPARSPSPAAAAAGDGTCVITVSSSPWAEVWLDEHNTGRRTPLSGYRLPCGDHKLVLKRNDLDIYQMEMITIRAGTPFRKSYPLR